MFGFFNSTNKRGLPVSDDQRKWLEHAFMYLLDQFDYEKITMRQVYTPQEFFSYDFSNNSQTIDVAKQIAETMEIDFNEIQIDFFSSGMQGYYGATGDILYMGQEEGSQNPTGQYFEKNDDGKYLIALADNLYKDPEGLISTISHEFSHIKLLGEKRIEQNNEHLTDIVPLVFGLGIFSANSAFKFTTSRSGWSHSQSGYLSQMDWGYLFALYAYIRYEEKPDWLKYLNKEIQNDFISSASFIANNKELIFSHLKNE